MAEFTEDAMAEIGLAAGRIWNCLHENGAMSLARLVKELDVSRDLILQGTGWLSREGKLAFQKTPRGRTISLR